MAWHVDRGGGWYCDGPCLSKEVLHSWPRHSELSFADLVANFIGIATPQVIPQYTPYFGSPSLPYTPRSSSPPPVIVPQVYNLPQYDLVPIEPSEYGEGDGFDSDVTVFSASVVT